jgi:hypothetical protein
VLVKWSFVFQDGDDGDDFGDSKSKAGRNKNLFDDDVSNAVLDA